MNCKDCALLLLDYHFDTLAQYRRAEVAEHLVTCDECRATLEKLKTSVPDQLAWPEEDPPEDLTARTLVRVQAQQQADRDAAASAPPDLPTPIHKPEAQQPWSVRPFLKAIAAVVLVGVATWAWSVQQRRVSLVAAVDGQDQLSPGGLTTLRMSVFDADDHEPIPGATVRVLLRGPDGKDTVVYEGVSDSFGTLHGGRRLPDLPEGGYTLVVEATKGSESTSFSQPVTVARRFRVLVSADKPSYQPGQTIHVRALARDVATGKPPEGRELTFTVVDAKGNKVGRTTQKIDRFGVASLDFPVADEVLLGTWRVEAELGAVTSAVDVSVARYTLPKFQVKLTTDKPWYRPGDVVSGRIETRYFFGKPVAGARAKLTAGVFVDKFRAVAEATGTADDQGVWGFEMALPHALPGLALAQGSAAVDLAFEVTDRAGQRVDKHQGLVIAAEPLTVTLVPEGGALAMDVENRLLALVVRPDGEPVVGARVSLEAEPGTPPGTTGEDGIAVLAFTPRTLRRDLNVRVQSADGSSLVRSVVVAADQLPGVVRTEKTLYTAGDTVRGEVVATSPAGAAFLDVVRDGSTIATHTVPLQGGKGAFAVDLPADAAGTVTLYAYMPGRDTKRARKTLYVGEPRSLQLSISGDRETYLPGKEATLRLKVAGDDGKPAVASVGVAVVDESVFALAASEPALLKAYFLLAEELSKPKYELDPARVVAGGAGRDRAAALLFSQPRPDEIKRVAQTADGELSTRRAALLEKQKTASTTGWGLGLVLLGVLFEGGVRFLFEKLLKRFFQGKWWRTGALLLGGGLGFWAKVSGAPELAIVFLGVLPLVAVLCLELLVHLLSGNFGTAVITGGGVVLIGVGLVAVFGPNLRALFGTTASVLGGATSPRDTRQYRRTFNNFGLADRDGGGGGFAPEPLPAAALPAEKGLGAFGLEGGERRLQKARADEAPRPATAAEKAQVRVRSWFPETMFWAPGVITGPDGTASVTVPVADSITSWRVSATASAADGRLGVGQGALRVFQDFFVDIDLPVALTIGDEVEVPIAVHNYLGEPQTVKLEVEAQPWFSAMTPVVQEVALAAGEVRGVPLRLRAAEFGKKTLTVYAFGSKLKDAIRREVEVRPNGLRVESAVGGVLAERTRASATLPPGTIAGSEKVLLRIYPGLFSAALDGIEGMFRMPYGCFEQTSSTTYPNVLVLDYLRQSGRSKPDVEARAIEYIQQGYQRLLSFEVQGGGFEWFGRAPANQVLTAYGLLEFADMAKVYAIDPAVVRRTQEWLISKQNADGSWEPDARTLRDGLYRDQFTGRVGTTAYVAWALAESGYRGPAVDRALSFLLSRSGELGDGYTLALVANALLASDRPGNASSLLDRLASKADTADGKLRIAAGGRTAVFSAGAAADVETTSLAAVAFARAGRIGRAGPAIDWLLSARDHSGAWGSTQATVLALRALLRTSTGGQDADANADVVVRVGGETAGAVQIRPENSDLVQTLDLTAAARAKGSVAVELEMTGTARAQYQLVTLAWVPKPRKEDDLALKLDYDRVTLAPDDTITARVNAVWRPKAPSGMVMLALGVPPGFDVDAGSVGQLVAEGKVGKFTLTGKELLLYVDSLEPGTPLELRYKLKARYPVKVKAPASVAYLYYQPEVRAESAPLGLVIRR